MAWTQTQIDALENAIAMGALRVSFEGRDVEYRSLSEMAQILKMMKADVAGSPVVMSTLATFSKG